MLCVVTGGSEFRLRANTRRLSKILSSEERRSSALGTSVPCSLGISCVRHEVNKAGNLIEDGNRRGRVYGTLGQRKGGSASQNRSSCRDGDG